MKATHHGTRVLGPARKGGEGQGERGWRTEGTQELRGCVCMAAGVGEKNQKYQGSVMVCRPRSLRGLAVMMWDVGPSREWRKGDT